jgi:two-component system CitB family response regulator
MIRTVVVDDDYRVASIHAAYVDKVGGFEAIAQVHTAAAAVDAVNVLKPELLLLDLYLPEEHGLDLVARLRGTAYPPVDVIVITAAKDADSVRAAMQHGALHYLLKPFSFPALRDKLLSYAQMRSRLDGLRAADQRSVDRVYGALRAPGQVAASKGRSDYTLETVEELLSGTGGGPVRRRGGRADRHEPGHRPAVPDAPARPGPGGDPAALWGEWPPRARLPLGARALENPARPIAHVARGRSPAARRALPGCGGDPGPLPYR